MQRMDEKGIEKSLYKSDMDNITICIPWSDQFSTKQKWSKKCFDRCANIKENNENRLSSGGLIFPSLLSFPSIRGVLFFFFGRTVYCSSDVATFHKQRISIFIGWSSGCLLFISNKNNPLNLLIVTLFLFKLASALSYISELIKTSGIKYFISGVFFRLMMLVSLSAFLTICE